MGALRGAVLAVALLAATPARAAPAADPVARWHDFIVEAAARFAIPADWIERVMRAESGGRTTLGGRPIVSRKGAIGLMQVMPATWAAMRSVYALGPDPFDPHDNILAGAAYLRQMVDRFGYPGALAAYNAGPRRYAAYLTSGTPLPGETRAYLATLTGAPDIAVTASARPRDGLFVALGASSAVAPDPLFAVRHDVRAAAD